MTNYLPLMERIHLGDQVTISHFGRQVVGTVREAVDGGWIAECGSPIRRWHVTTENVRLCRRKGKTIFQVLNQEHK